MNQGPVISRGIALWVLGLSTAAEEIQSASHQLDDRIFRQEFEASFETLGVGRAYYAFDRSENVTSLDYNGRSLLCWALDFNMNPMCSVLAQIRNGAVYILEEMILPDSSTLAACEEFLSRTEKWRSGRQLGIVVYGDATAEQRRTSASRTDWEIVKEFFGRHPYEFTASFRVPTSNPPVKDRVNRVNAKLRNHAGLHMLGVDSSCKHLIKDFEQVCWKTDPHGNPLAELDKSDPMRTHVSDALGYLVAREFPMRPVRGEMGGPAII